MHLDHAARRAAPALTVALLSLAGPVSAVALLVTVRVGDVPVVGATPIFVLDCAGRARDAGIEIATTTLDSGPSAIQGLASGAIDVLANCAATIAVAHSTGSDAVAARQALMAYEVELGDTPTASSTDGLFDESVPRRAVRSGASRP